MRWSMSTETPMALLPIATMPRCVPWAISVARRAVCKLVGRGITEGREGLRKATPAIHRHEQLFNTDTGQVRLNHAAQFLDAWRHFECIIPFGAQAVLPDRHKGIGRQAGHGLPGDAIKGLAELPECLGRPPRHGQLGIRLVALLRPLRVVIDQLPKGDMASARREIEGART